MLSVDLNVLPPWSSGPARKIIETLGGADSILVVGGCVRDWLSDIPVKDIDFATKLLPKKSFKVLESKGFKVKKIGIEHGTLKVIVGSKIFEITSLRKDISTDGRHAVVKFGKDWLEDASRRDFTINALYADAKGTIYDPLGKGFQDLKDKKLRFIGDPQKRIQEDYLRIIRYFRFLSRFSENIDDNSFKSCIKEAKNISLLSGERVFSELSKILLSNNADFVFKKMQSHGLLKYIFTRKEYYSLYFKEGLLELFFKNVSNNHQLKNKFLIFLSLLFNKEVKDISDKVIYSIVDRFNFSKNDARLLLRNLDWITNIDIISSRDVRALWLDYGKQEIEDLKLILKVFNYNKYEVLKESLKIKPPKFPCSGKDAKKVGFIEGDTIGLALNAAREWWIDNNCEPSYKDCLNQLEKEFMARKH